MPYHITCPCGHSFECDLLAKCPGFPVDTGKIYCPSCESCLFVAPRSFDWNTGETTYQVKEWVPPWMLTRLEEVRASLGIRTQRGFCPREWSPTLHEVPTGRVSTHMEDVDGRGGIHIVLHTSLGGPKELWIIGMEESEAQGESFEETFKELLERRRKSLKRDYLKALETLESYCVVRNPDE